jgi:hypothetical protein
MEELEGQNRFRPTATPPRHGRDRGAKIDLRRVGGGKTNSTETNYSEAQTNAN